MAAVSFARLTQSAGAFLTRLTTIKPYEPKLTVGLDVGSTSVKAVALGTRKGSGARPILARHLTPLSPGQEADPSEAIKDAVAALELPARTVNLSVSGPWVVMRVVEMPRMKLAEFKQALLFEAQRYLPFSGQDVIVDGAVLGSIDASRAWALIVACKKELVERRLDWLKRAGLEAALIDVDALALCNGFLANADGRPAPATRALINVGGQFTNLVICQGEIPYLIRDIPWGGARFVHSVAEHSGFDEAAVGQELRQDTVRPELPPAMKLAAETLTTELQLSFDYFENRFGQPPEALLVSGGLARCPGFVEALKGLLTQAVSLWAPVSELSPQFTIAYGLALRIT
jgi:type IV pilus assembly protein PilM